MSAAPAMTGAHLAPEHFSVEEYDDVLPADAIARLLDGRLAGLLLREALPEPQRRAILERFWRQTGRERREGAAAGTIVGAYHYGRSGDEYLEQAAETRDAVSELLGEENPVDMVATMVASAVAPRGQTVRLAAHGPKIAAQARVASWSTRGKFLLEPHEDIAQLSHPDLAELEISRMYDRPVIAINVYPEMPDNGGFLRIWNIDPDEAARRRFGTEHSGYYYPEEALDGTAFLEVAPRAGSMFMLNARLIHAVVGYEDTDTAARRLSVNFLMGCLDDDTVIYWA